MEHKEMHDLDLIKKLYACKHTIEQNMREVSLIEAELAKRIETKESKENKERDAVKE